MVRDVLTIFIVVFTMIFQVLPEIGFTFPFPLALSYFLLFIFLVTIVLYVILFFLPKKYSWNFSEDLELTVESIFINKTKILLSDIDKIILKIKGYRNKQSIGRGTILKDGSGNHIEIRAKGFIYHIYFFINTAYDLEKLKEYISIYKSKTQVEIQE